MRFPITLSRTAALAGILFATAVHVHGDEDTPSLRAGVSAGGAPMAYFEQGVLRGLEVELDRALADALGRELRLQEMPQPRLIDALRGGRIDLVLSGLPDTDLAALGLAASSPLLETGQMALIRAAEVDRFARPVDLITTKARVGYQHGTAGARFVQAQLPWAERMPYPDAASGIAALRNGEIDVFVHDATTIWAVAADADEHELIGIFQALTDERLAWVVRSEDELLRRNIDFVIRSWRRSGKLSALINSWIRVQVEVEH